ncbi:hypothetical protein BHE74_00013891 [Ensete ventricosum]|nr:hypothetical protein BHE74_00013891 [Ensete ventricosum]
MSAQGTRSTANLLFENNESLAARRAQRGAASRRGGGGGRGQARRLRRSEEMGDGRGGGGGGNRPAWLQQYELVGKIGEGTYGLVFLARTSLRKGCIAIKKFKQSKEGDGVSPTAIREIMVRIPPLIDSFRWSVMVIYQISGSWSSGVQILRLLFFPRRGYR